MITDSQYQAFINELEQFEEWLLEIKDRRLAVAFQINAVKPRFVKEVAEDHAQVRLAGYLLAMRSGFIDRTSFVDPLYAIITPSQQAQWSFAGQDRVEAQAIVKIDRGRLVLTGLRSIQIEERSGQPTWNNSQALVAKANASYFPRQAEGCLHCPQGALVDVTETERGRVREKRDLYCLAGMPDQQECYLYALHKVDLCYEHG